MAAGGVAVLVAAVAVPFFPTTFLPPFNEGTLLVGLRLNPGVTLAETVGAGAPGRGADQAGARGHARRAPQRPRRARRACRRRARQRARRGPEADRRADAQHGRDQGRHPRAAGQPAGRASTSASRSRTASTTCSRACARRSRSRSSARTSTRCAARPMCCARRLAAIPGIADLRDREAGAGAADQGARRLRRRGAVRRAGAAGAGRAAKPGRGREGHADRRGQPALRAGGASCRSRRARWRAWARS